MKHPCRRDGSRHPLGLEGCDHQKYNRHHGEQQRQPEQTPSRVSRNPTEVTVGAHGHPFSGSALRPTTPSNRGTSADKMRRKTSPTPAAAPPCKLCTAPRHMPHLL